VCASASGFQSLCALLQSRILGSGVGQKFRTAESHLRRSPGDPDWPVLQNVKRGDTRHNRSRQCLTSRPISVWELVTFCENVCCNANRNKLLDR
jgi:hypothetical protein